MRTCDGCTKCCDGWLWGEAHGHKFYKGRPCHFIGPKGCTIYDSRPESPCRTFRCEWLINEDIPAWMKPDKINAIIVRRTRDDNREYFEINEAGATLDVRVLSWFTSKIFEKDSTIKSIRWEVEGGWNQVWIE